MIAASLNQYVAGFKHPKLRVIPEAVVFVSDLKVNASVKEVSQIFGFGDDGNVGMYDWPFYQSAASFSQAFPHIFSGRPAYCLIPCAIDQDPYFRLGRDLAQRMKLLKTSTLWDKINFFLSFKLSSLNVF